MRAVIQRVKNASVEVNNNIVGKIDHGYLVLVGIEDADQSEDIAWLTKKIVQMRLFPDENGVMNKSILETEGDILVVSQFTLHASTKKGNRPSYIKASRPEFAIPMYEKFVKELESLLGRKVETGIFGADMQVSLCNDGPVTICIDTQNKE